MFHKRCAHCNGLSFSASSQGMWLCPYCGEDITETAAVLGQPLCMTAKREDKQGE
ncbi:MAG: hypothetical protein KGZ92_05625 [Firmicutes bacterium]|nr:hypothetical protein [Dethiobacter sp.]MBS3888767.1 hypothetical protein [Bacillota bacterium]